MARTWSKTSAMKWRSRSPTGSVVYRSKATRKDGHGGHGGQSPVLCNPLKRMALRHLGRR